LLSPDLLRTAAGDLKAAFEPQYGGFGGAPKFPSCPAIALLLRQYAHTGDGGLRAMAESTLKNMYYGGLYDHLGGGFHRYSTDAAWLVPHFEKMLYDNAQLADVYLEAYQLTGNSLYRRVAEEIFEYVMRDMQDGAGAFYSTEDADSEGEEGKFYLWTRDEIFEVLGEKNGEAFCRYYNVRPEGNFTSHEPYHAGQNILHLKADAHGEAPPEPENMAGMRARLLEVRNRRVRPGRDDKVLASWNGLMIASFAQGYQVLRDDRYREAAERAADFILTTMVQDGVLLRSYRDGRSRFPGYLDDYAFMVNALVNLYEATFDVKWLEAADVLGGRMTERFWDERAGGFFFASEEHQHLLVRTKPTYDGAEPSGNSMAAAGLFRLAKLTGKEEYADKAERVLEVNGGRMAASPRAHLKMLCVLDFYLDPPKEIAIAGTPGSEPVEAFLEAVHGCFIPNKVVALIDPANRDAAAIQTRIPLLVAKELQNGRAAVYVCRDFTCRQPVTTVEDLVEVLDVEAGGGST
jgi:uncharacterized protein YyaL (SSP411 family)